MASGVLPRARPAPTDLGPATRRRHLTSVAAQEVFPRRRQGLFVPFDLDYLAPGRHTGRDPHRPLGDAKGLRHGSHDRTVGPAVGRWLSHAHDQ